VHGKEYRLEVGVSPTPEKSAPAFGPDSPESFRDRENHQVLLVPVVRGSAGR